MKKIISLFVRNYETDRLVRDEIVPRSRVGSCRRRYPHAQDGRHLLHGTRPKAIQALRSKSRQDTTAKLRGRE